MKTEAKKTLPRNEANAIWLNSYRNGDSGDREENSKGLWKTKKEEGEILKTRKKDQVNLEGVLVQRIQLLWQWAHFSKRGCIKRIVFGMSLLKHPCIYFKFINKLFKT